MNDKVKDYYITLFLPREGGFQNPNMATKNTPETILSQNRVGGATRCAGRDGPLLRETKELNHGSAPDVVRRQFWHQSPVRLRHDARELALLVFAHHAADCAEEPVPAHTHGVNRVLFRPWSNPSRKPRKMPMKDTSENTSVTSLSI